MKRKNREKMPGFITILLVLSFTPVKAQEVMWNLKGGIMQRSFYSEPYTDDKDKRIDWMAGLEIEIPINQKFNIETGLRYKDHFSITKDYYTENKHIEMPLRLAYKQPLGEYFTLDVGVGPYASYAFEPNFGDKWHHKMHVGLEPSVVVNWACLSLGASYNFPCFYKGYKDRNDPAVMVTLGIRFKSKAWKYIGAGLLAVATVGTAALAVWPSDDNYSSSGSYSSSSYNSSYSSSSSSSGGSTSEQQSYNSDKRTYENYDSMLSSHFYGSRSATANEVRQWQQAMKNLRTKWTAKGKSFSQSQNETKSTNNCSSSSHSH